MTFEQEVDAAMRSATAYQDPSGMWCARAGWAKARGYGLSEASAIATLRKKIASIVKRQRTIRARATK